MPPTPRLMFSVDMITTESPGKISIRSARTLPMSSGGSPDSVGARSSAPSTMRRSISVGAERVVSTSTP